MTQSKKVLLRKDVKVVTGTQFIDKFMAGKVSYASLTYAYEELHCKETNISLSGYARKEVITRGCTLSSGVEEHCTIIYSDGLTGQMVLKDSVTIMFSEKLHVEVVSVIFNARTLNIIGYELGENSKGLMSYMYDNSNCFIELVK